MDVGSNTVHVLVADTTDGGLADVAHYVEMPGLGSAVARSGRIGRAKSDEAIAALESVMARAAQHGFEHLVAGATAAVREAADSREFLERADATLGVPMRLISEEAEAQLSFLGVASRHATRRDWLMVDLGGGSTEVVAGQGGRITRWVSLRLGSGVLGSELSDPPRGPEIDDLKRKARLELERTPDRRPVRLVATGGTASNLPRLLGSRERKELSATDLERCRHRLGESRADEVARRHQLSEQRVLALRGGVEILLLLLERYDLDRFRITHEGLRHGMILAYRRRGEDWYLPS